MELELQRIKENIEAVQLRIQQAAARSGRSANAVHLVAATKMNTSDRVQLAIQSGIRMVGENRVQELLEKYDQQGYEGAELHFIGNLQSNKVKYLLGKVSLIQSVGSQSLGLQISREAQKRGICQDILLQVNIGGEDTKGGVNPALLQQTIEFLSTLPSIRIRGIMAIPPVAHASGENLSYFSRMSELFIDISQKKYDNVFMDYLSMGMSGDFEDAISCGSNMVRIGSAILGSRPYMR